MIIAINEGYTNGLHCRHMQSDIIVVTLKGNSLDAPAIKPFQVHKSLLASASPELHNHVYNDMKEGVENALQLEEVDEATMKRFLSWLYTKTYRADIDSEIDTYVFVPDQKFLYPTMK